MPVTAQEAAMAVAGAAETWGRRRRTAPESDTLSTEGLTGCALEVLGLTDLIPEHHPRESLAAVCERTPELAARLTRGALAVLRVAHHWEDTGHPWQTCASKARDAAAEQAVLAEAAETRSDLRPVVAEEVRLPDTVQVVTLRRPRTDDLPPCPAASPAVQLLGGVAVSFGCGDTAEHAGRDHAWVITWG